MTGVIWFVQHVHYPLLAQVEMGQAVAVAEEHQRRTGHVVALPMAFEGLTTLALLAQQPEGGQLVFALDWGHFVGCCTWLHGVLVGAFARKDGNES